MPRRPPQRPAHLVLGLLGLLGAALAPSSAGAQCVDIANGDVLVADISSPGEIIKITDVSVGADTLNNQEIVCGGPIAFPRSIDVDREGRIWVSMTDGIVRTDPAVDDQLRVFQLGPGLFASPEGILKLRDGPVYIASPPYVALSQVLQVDEATGVASGLTSLGNTGVPLGLIFDPAGDDPEDMLLVDSGSAITLVVPGLYEINEAGGLNGLARNGYIATPFRPAAVNSRYVYVSDIGGSVDPDGAGPEVAAVSMPQIVRVDRDVPFDFADPEADGRVNQTVIAAGGEFIWPIGVAVLEEDGVNPDSLLVADPFARGGALFRVDFDPAATTPSGVVNVVAEGVDFVSPWEVKVVSGIDPLPRNRIFLTDTAALPANTGVFYVDGDGSSGPYATGMTRPTGIVVDPLATDEQFVADAGVPEILRVVPATPNTGTASSVSSGGMLMDPRALVVDHAGDILVADAGAGAVLRVDRGTGVQSVVAQGDCVNRPVAIGIDPDGYIQVADENDPGDDNDARLLRINPVTGRQFLQAESRVIGSTGFAFDIDGTADLAFDTDGSSLYSVDFPPPDPDEQPPAFQVPVLRFVPPPVGFFEESDSADYVTPRGIALAENRDVLSILAGDPMVNGDGVLVRLDPLLPSVPGDPEIVAGGQNLEDPWGVAIAELPRPSPPPADSDGDGIFDPEDNCIFTANPGQEDDVDDPPNLRGDACDSPIDCDVNGDSSVGVPDFVLLIDQFGNDCNVESSADCSADCQETPDNIVGLPDFARLMQQVGNQRGTPGSLVGQPTAAESCP